MAVGDLIMLIKTLGTLLFREGQDRVWVPEDVCRKNGYFEDQKEQMTQGWDKLDKR